MVGAIIEIKGSYSGFTCFYVAKNAGMICKMIEYDQDINCLSSMAMDNIKKEKAEDVKALYDFVEKYNCGNITIEDFNGLNVNLTVGIIKCYDIAKNDEEIETLKKKYPDIHVIDFY